MIKQNGGVFGRNPEFNNVTIDGTLTVAGSPVVTGTFTAPSGTIAGIAYWDGSKLVNDSTVTDNGYDVTNNNSVSRGYALSAAGVMTEATTSRTLAASDNGKVIYCTNGGTTTITTLTGLGAGFSVTIIQGGAGKVTIAQGASTTLVSYGSFFSTLGQYSVITLFSAVANTYIASGNLGT